MVHAGSAFSFLTMGRSHATGVRCGQVGTCIAAAFLSSACFQMSAVIKVSADGSGTIEHQFAESRTEIARVRQGQLSLGLSLDMIAAVDPHTEYRAQSHASGLGPGVRYRSSSPIETPEWHGRASVYAFDDISQLQFSQGQDIFGASPGGDSPVVTAFRCSVAYAPNGNAVLHIKLTKPDWYLPRDPSKAGGGPVLPYEYTVQQTLDEWASRSPGGHVSIAVEPNGHLVRTNSPFVDGNRVTVLEVDVDRALGNQSLLSRLKAGRTVDEYWSAIKSAPGLKVTLEPEITIEFEPER
jgi:hypothetical protein